MSRFYTVSQTAKILGFSTNSIYKFLDAKRLKSTRGNSKQGRFRIPHTSIEEFLGMELSETAVAQALAKSKTKPKMPPPLTPSPPQIPQTPPPEPRHLTKPNIQKNDVLPDTRASHTSPLPTNISRFLILVALIFTIFEVITSPAITITSQLFRLFILAITILLAYQSGGSKEDHIK
jgi:hypothetical protein